MFHRPLAQLLPGVRGQDGQDAAQPLGWPEVEEAVKDVLELVEEKAAAELAELEDDAGETR